jgi:SAM-dependent methyltransferase
MVLTEKSIREMLPNDHARQVNAEYYILNSNEPPQGIDFLDLGAGDGRSFDVAKEKFNKLRWTGLDIPDSPEVRDRKRTDCTFVSYDGVRIPFPDSSFDIVYSRQVFEHVRHPEQVLSEIKRVLKTDGIFVGSVSQLEPYHSLSLWNFTFYGFAVICADAGLDFVEYRPGVDGLTLTARNLILFGLRRNALPWTAIFSAMLTGSSPLNDYIDKLPDTSIQAKNYLKVSYSGHLCFKFRKSR